MRKWNCVCSATGSDNGNKYNTYREYEKASVVITIEMHEQQGWTLFSYSGGSSDSLLFYRDE